MALTANEQNFVRQCVRLDSDADRLRVWRELKMPGWEKQDNGVTRRMRRLLNQDDAKMLRDSELLRMGEQRSQAMKEADKAGWERSKALAELDRQAIESLTAALKARTEAVLENPSESLAHDVAKMADVAQRLAARGADAPQLTTEDREALLRQAGLIQPERRGEATPAAPDAPPSVVVVDTREGRA